MVSTHKKVNPGPVRAVGVDVLDLRYCAGSIQTMRGSFDSTDCRGVRCARDDGHPSMLDGGRLRTLTIRLCANSSQLPAADRDCCQSAARFAEACRLPLQLLSLLPSICSHAPPIGSGRGTPSGHRRGERLVKADSWIEPTLAAAGSKGLSTVTRDSDRNETSGALNRDPAG